MSPVYARSAASFFFFSSRRRHTRFDCDWSSDVCSSSEDGAAPLRAPEPMAALGWPRAIPILLAMVRHYRLRLLVTFGPGIPRVAALIGVGVLSALPVRPVTPSEPVTRLPRTLPTLC